MYDLDDKINKKKWGEMDYDSINAAKDQARSIMQEQMINRGIYLASSHEDDWAKDSGRILDPNQVRWIGTAPACEAKEYDCQVTPGFIAKGSDKCGDGKCCWGGQKIKCGFDQNRFTNTCLYQQIKDAQKNDNDHFYNKARHEKVFFPKELDEGKAPGMRWFGSAPSCNGTQSFCEAVVDDYYPMRKHGWGDGAQCAKTGGYKVLGVRPFTEAQYNTLKTIKPYCVFSQAGKLPYIKDEIGFIAGKPTWMMIQDSLPKEEKEYWNKKESQDDMNRWYCK
jgi:hypothetical protein